MSFKEKLVLVGGIGTFVIVALIICAVVLLLYKRRSTILRINEQKAKTQMTFTVQNDPKDNDENSVYDIINENEITDDNDKNRAMGSVYDEIVDDAKDDTSLSYTESGFLKSCKLSTQDIHQSLSANTAENSDYITPCQSSDYMTQCQSPDCLSSCQNSDYITPCQSADYLTPYLQEAKIAHNSDYITPCQRSDYLTPYHQSAKITNNSEYITPCQRSDYITPCHSPDCLTPFHSVAPNLKTKPIGCSKNQNVTYLDLIPDEQTSAP